MIQVADLIKLFQLMYKQHWAYSWGAAEKGCVDCSGAFVYAYRELEDKSIVHGSNGIARKWTVGGMLPLSRAEPGMGAFKTKQPGEEGYDLPERYRQNGASYTGDLTDYYHIGLVDEDPHYVLNAKGTKQGFCRDALTIKNGWDFVSYLKDVEYGGGESEKHMDAKVVLPSGASGDTVNMRSKPSKDSPLVFRVPIGSLVDILVDQGAWCKIDYAGKQGWMMSNYLEYEDQDGESEDSYVKVSKKELEDIYNQIGNWLGLRG